MRRMLYPIRKLHRLFSRRLLVAALHRTQQADTRTKKSRRRSERSALERRSAFACTESHCDCHMLYTARLATTV